MKLPLPLHSFLTRISSINLARLNHLLIPETKDQRDRLRRTRMGRAFSWFWFLYERLTPEGSACALFAVLSLAFSLDVIASDAHLVWAGLSSLCITSLVVSRFFPLPCVRLLVSHPRRIVAGGEIHFVLSLHLEGGPEAPDEYRGLRLYGPFLPWDGKYLGSRPEVARLLQGQPVRVTLRACFTQRGEHHLESFRVAALVPYCLAQGPSVYSEGVKFLVVPKMANVDTVTTPRGGRHQPGGVLLASKTGESMELSGVRPYRAGDPVRDLHAKSWARTGTPVVREYQQEYFSRIGIVLDTDLLVLSELGRKGEAVLEGALSLCAGLVHALCRGESLIDLLVVGETLHPLTLGRSLGTVDQALDLLACVTPSAALSQDKVFANLRPHLQRLSCVLLIFLRMDESRRALAERIGKSGVAARSFVVLDGPAAGPAVGGWTVVPLASIQSGQVLRL